MAPLPPTAEYPATRILVDEALIGMAGGRWHHLVLEYPT